MLKKIRQRIEFGRRSFDPVRYWTTRASEPATMSVMWANLAFNKLVDGDEWRVIKQHIGERRGRVLDLGCGTGRMAVRLAQEFDRYTGVDMEAMVSEARLRNPTLADGFIAATVEEYEFPSNTFDFVLSLGCLATACSKHKLIELAPRIASSIAPGGRLLLVEPFHRSSLLTRGCRISSDEVAALFTAHNLQLRIVDGILFPPTRMVLSEKIFDHLPNVTRVGYKVGEGLVRFDPKHLSDYKVLSFERPSD